MAIRTPSARGNPAILRLATTESPLAGDAWPQGSRSRVSLPPFGALSLPARLQAPVLSEFAGVGVSVPTAQRIARAYREAHGSAE